MVTRTKKMRRRAFTLVELLVVIGIIALLLGILMPSLASTRRQAQAVVCLSNLRQVGVGLLLYAQDNKGYFPRSSMTANWPPPQEPFLVRPWPEALFSYLTTGTFESSHPTADASDRWQKLFWGMYRCPSDLRGQDGTWKFNLATLYEDHWSYAKNVLPEYGKSYDPRYTQCLKITQIPRSSATVLFAETKADGMGDHFMVDDWSADGSDATIDKTRHGSVSNYLYCDGHAAAASFADVFDPPHAVNKFDPQLAR